MKSTLTKYFNWVERNNNQGLWVGWGRSSSASRFGGGRVRLVAEVEVSWASSTLCEDLLRARPIPDYRNPKMGNLWKSAGVGFWYMGLFCTWNLSFPLRIPCPLCCPLGEWMTKVLWTEGGHETQAQTSGKFYLEMSDIRNKNDGPSPQNISPKEVAQ